MNIINLRFKAERKDYATTSSLRVTNYSLDDPSYA
jgi:hypothetical protein